MVQPLNYARTLKAAYALEWIDIEAAARTAGATWEPFQIEFLNYTGRLAAWVKARQIAWSFTAALDAVADSVTDPGTPHIFVSVNLNEAKEKIRYARAIIDAIRPEVRPTVTRVSQTEIEFANGSRLLSHPCRPVLGKANARVYLDEMAHYPADYDRAVYRAALPATIRGNGYMRVGSSPLGASGLFWEIVRNIDGRFPDYMRRRIPWWEAYALCTNVPEARQLAPDLPTAERVMRWGTAPLREIFANMFLEDFQQEYECAWLDEITAWISWEVLKGIRTADLDYFEATSVDAALGMIPAIEAAVAEGRFERVFAGGLDVGRVHDLTEFVLLGRATTGRLPLRVRVSLRDTEYDDQIAVVREYIKRLPVAAVLIDKNGIGNQLAETLERTGRAEGVDFTNATKELWAVEAKIQAVRGNALLPLDRDMALQIHSIKKRVTPSGNNVYDAERNAQHHADFFWAWALALWAAKVGAKIGVPVGQGSASGWQRRVKG